MAASQSNTSGIYAIRNLVNGKVYVGSAVQLQRRRHRHFWDLARGVHPNRHLQSAWDKHGESGFSFDILELASKDDLISREQHYIDKFKSCEKQYGYNLAPKAYSSLGVRFTPEQRAKRSASVKGRPKSAETRARMSAAWKFRQVTPEQIEKLRAMSAANASRPVSIETRLKMAAAQKGRKHSAETKAKITAGNLGNKNNLGKTKSAETRAKISAAHMGKPKPRKRSRFQKTFEFLDT